MSELVTARISAHAARLGLHQLAASAPALIQRAHDAQLGYADFLDLILGEETAAKDDRRFASAVHVSGLPHHKTLDDFDFTFQPCSPPLRVSMTATLTMRMSWREKPRPAVAGRGFGGRGGGVEVSLSRPPR